MGSCCVVQDSLHLAVFPSQPLRRIKGLTKPESKSKEAGREAANLKQNVISVSHS